MRPHLFPAFLLFSVALLPPLAAQRGDRAGEVQAPPPAHIAVPPAPVLSPSEEHATFKLAPGFRAELVAADPLVGDPVAMQFAPDGRLWVVEMRGFMPNADGVGEDAPVGCVAVLEDTDADGRFDKRSVFADKLVLPRALALIGDGLLLGVPPRLIFLRDTNGDGVADETTEVAGGYGTTDNPEHSANGLLWAMDNWIYSAKHDVRYRWLGGAKFAREETIPRGQWGIAQDDVGRIFYNTNSDPLRHDPVPSAYLKRNANFAATGTNVQLVPGNLRIWPDRVTVGVNRGYQILNSEGKITSMTAASGPVVYRGALFPAEFHRNAFVPAPEANLIKRIKLTEKDGRLVGENAYENAEFMTSTDERFRPVNLYNGPDGALYVVDMYRGIIQHRIFMTTFLRKQVDERKLAEGRGHGRIWRIVPESAPKANFQSGLARATAAELVEKLGDANGWVRDTAQRLLVERRDTADRERLLRLVGDAEANSLARLHALWALEGRGEIDRAVVLRALEARDARVAAAAVRLAENFLTGARADAEVAAKVIALATHRVEPAVRLQLALTLGELRTPPADEAMRALVVAAGRQPFLADAVVSGLAGREEDFIAELSRDPRAEANAGEVIRFATSAVLKSGNAGRIDRILTPLAAAGTAEWVRTAILAGVRNFLPRTPDGRGLAGNLPAEPKPLLALAEKADLPSATVAKQLVAELRWPGKPGMVTTTVRPLNARDQAAFERGKAQYAAVCVACHQANGQGLAGLAPSLVNSRWVLGDPGIAARVVLNGKARENLIMPPWKTLLDDTSIAEVLTFIRRSWGHEADPVTVAVVATERAATANRTTPYTEEALLELQAEIAPGAEKK